MLTVYTASMRIITLLLSVLFCFSNTLVAQTTWRFEDAVRNYAYRSIDHPPVPGCTLFAGSSSFAGWKNLEETFADYEAVNRGFGGSTFLDNLRVIEWIHLPIQPAKIVIFCGTNDIAGGADAETVFNNFTFYIARTWNENPATEIYFVSVTHAPVREKLWSIGDELCAKIKQLSETVKGLFFIDIISPMEDENGKVREDLFVADRLHLNETGYAIWAKTFKGVLDEQDKNRQKPNLVELYASRKAAGLFDDSRFAEQGIAVRDYSEPPRKRALVFIGDNVMLDEVPSRCFYFLTANGYDEIAFASWASNAGTTFDLTPDGEEYKHIKNSADRLNEGKDRELIFSIMLGANDSAKQPPLSPEEYRRNMKAIVDKLLTDYPASKVVLHRPIGYPAAEQLRLQAYFPELKILVDFYSHSTAKGRVFLGDVSAFHYFQTNAEKVFAKQKPNTFHIPLNERGADVLGRFWGSAILQALR